MINATERKIDVKTGSILHVLEASFRNNDRIMASVFDNAGANFDYISSLNNENKLDEFHSSKNSSINSESKKNEIIAKELHDLLKYEKTSALNNDMVDNAELKRYGLISNVHIPSGKSHLQYSKNLESFDKFSSSIIVAGDILKQSIYQKLLESGNGTTNVKPVLDLKNIKDPAYLKSTSLTVSRKNDALSRSFGIHGHRSHRKRISHTKDECLRKDQKWRSILPLPVELGLHEPLSKSCSSLLSGVQKDADMKAIQSIESKLNFMHHPKYDLRSRFHNSVLTSQYNFQSCKDSVNHSNYFVAEPLCIYFSDFKPGVIYDAVILLRNISSIARRLQIVLPQSQYFFLGKNNFPSYLSEKENTRCNGLIAPGMATMVHISFSPDSLENRESHLTVRTESGPITVPIIACRSSPILSIPIDGVIDCGVCMLGFASTYILPIKNTGSPVKIQFSWYETAYLNCEVSKINNDKMLHIDEFTLWPTELCIGKNEKKVVNIEFFPRKLGLFKAQLKLSQDDGQLRKITLIGHCDNVRLSFVEADPAGFPTSNACIPSSTIQLPSSTAGVQSSYTLWVQNKSMLLLDVHWKFDSNDCELFSVKPKKSIFESGATVPIQVFFQSKKACNLTSVKLIGVVNGVPQSICQLGDILHSNAEADDTSIYIEFTHSSHINCILSSLGKNFEPATLTNLMKKWLFFSETESTPKVFEGKDIIVQGLNSLEEYEIYDECTDIFTRLIDARTALELLGSSFIIFASKRLEHIPLHIILESFSGSYEALQINLQATAHPVKFSFSPEILELPGNLLYNTRNSCSFTICNDTEYASMEVYIDLSGIQVEFESDSENCNVTNQLAFVEVNQTRATILSGCKLTVDLAIRPTAIGLLTVTLPVSIPAALPHSISKPFLYKIFLNCCGPCIDIQHSHIDLGEIAVGSKIEKSVMLSNSSIVPLCFNLFIPQLSLSDELQAKSDMLDHMKVSDTFLEPFTEQNNFLKIEVQPNHGTILPGQSTNVTVKVHAAEVASLVNAQIVCCTKSDDNYRVLFETSSVTIKASVLKPEMRLSLEALNFGKTYTNVPVSRTVGIRNLTSLTTQFEIEYPASHSFTSYSISYSPSYGTLEGFGSSIIHVIYTPKNDSSDIIEDMLMFRVRGLADPLELVLHARNLPPMLSFECLEKDAIVPTPLQSPNEPQWNLPFEPPSIPPYSLSLNFGTVQLNKKSAIQFVVRNYSAVPAQLTVTPCKYNCAPSPPKHLISMNVSQSAFEKIVKTTNLLESYLSYDKSFMRSNTSTESPMHGSDFLLSSNHEVMNAYSSISGQIRLSERFKTFENIYALRNGQGVALLVSPPKCLLPPWGVATFSVTEYNDSPGYFSDKLDCQICTGNKEGEYVHFGNVIIPIQINVFGSAISFRKETLGLNVSLEPALLSFGEVLLFGNSSLRVLRIKNSSSLSGSLDLSMRSLAMSDTKKCEVVAVNIDTILDISDSNNLVSVSISCKEPDELNEVFLLDSSTASLSAYGEASFNIRMKSTVEGISKVLLVAKWNPTDKKTDTGNVRSEVLYVELQGTAVYPKFSLDLPPSLKGSPQEINFTVTTCQVPMSHQLSICLRNPFSIPLECSFYTSSPFHIRGVKTGTKKLNAKVRSKSNVRGECRLENYNSRFTVLSHRAICVEISFEPLDSILKSNADLCTSLLGALTIQFYADTYIHKQVINLRGEILQPFLAVSPPNYNFGIIHIDESTSTLLHIANHTRIAASWKIIHVATSHESRIHDNPDVFTFSEYQGTLFGPTLPLDFSEIRLPRDKNRSENAVWSQDKVDIGLKTGQFLTLDEGLCTNNERKRELRLLPRPIRVFFKPHTTGKFKCRIRFCVEGGPHFDIVLEGIGTLEENGNKYLT